jgi:hypothetical protein
LGVPIFNKRMLLAGVCVGFAYGLLARWVFAYHSFQKMFEVMSVAFIFGAPTVLGFLTVYIAEQREPEGTYNWGTRLILPWLPALAALFAALLLAWEGIICIFLWLPLFLVLSSAGGVLAGLVRLLVRKSGKGQKLGYCLAIVPFLLAPLEKQLPLPQQTITVDTQIEINSDAQTIWANIERVPAIRAEEHSFYLTHLLGFPKPVEARLIGAGVGAVRHATFEGGVLFVETVTEWETGKHLAFSIKADTSQIPATTLDQHVTVGGPYFDVLQGAYDIEIINAQKAILHLSSRHRLSTRFNSYAGWWTRFIMRDTQNHILKIIKQRCENNTKADSSNE